jgi:predicted metal-dependent enzyme (double-stranded beta helix superfamily)
MGATNDKLLTMVKGISQLVKNGDWPEPDVMDRAGRLMGDLIADDDWLPEAMAIPHPEFYRQYLLYGDPLDRFSLVSFVWGPGQQTPIHNHTVWGVIGMLRGAEKDQPYHLTSTGIEPSGPVRLLKPGDVAFVSPTVGDIHRVSNAFDDRVSISIHLYGGNIGRIQRSVYHAQTGVRKSFVSGYSNAMSPNLWAQPESTESKP